MHICVSFMAVFKSTKDKNSTQIVLHMANNFLALVNQVFRRHTSFRYDLIQDSKVVSRIYFFSTHFSAVLPWCYLYSCWLSSPAWKVTVVSSWSCMLLCWNRAGGKKVSIFILAFPGNSQGQLWLDWVSPCAHLWLDYWCHQDAGLWPGLGHSSHSWVKVRVNFTRST